MADQPKTADQPKIAADLPIDRDDLERAQDDIHGVALRKVTPEAE